MGSVEDGTMVAITAVFAPVLILVGLVATLISDVGIYLLLGGLFLFFLIIGIALVTGHAIGLVAGVNSMTESERQEYDLKKVGRAVGVFMLYCSVMPLLILDFNAGLLAAYIIVFLLILVWLLWYTNIRCRKTSRRRTTLNRTKDKHHCPDKTRRGGRLWRPLVPTGNGYSHLDHVYRYSTTSFRCQGPHAS